VSGRSVEISNPGKVFFPGLGASKLDVVATGYPFNRSNLEGWRLRGLV
jgi:hypothetical protein